MVPSVSVIVPIYNTKDYLSKCLDSLCSQTLKEIEIILIDDGSEDGSEKICDKYAQEDSRFQVIHRQHEGVSAARNAGLANAKAKYVMFVDSDDWVKLNFCELPYRTAEETGAEVVVFQRMWHDKNKAEIHGAFGYKGFISNEEALVKRWKEIGTVTWNKLYRRSLFDGIQFPVGRLSEDTAVIYRVLQRAHSIFFLDICLYHHLSGRLGSITTERTNRMNIDEITFNVRRIVDLRKWGYNCVEEEKQLAFRYLLLMGRKAEFSSECDRIVREYRGGSFISWKNAAAFGLYRISPGLFDLLSKLTGRQIR